MWTLCQFIFRVSFGLSLAMAFTSPRQVTSGYYRNHLYVLLGLNVLATLVAVSQPATFPVAPPLTAALLCYLGSVVWLYAKREAGTLVLLAISAVSLWGAWNDPSPGPADMPSLLWLTLLDAPTSGLVLGGTLAAMFLGHWYLNAPGMELEPLRRLVIFMAAAVLIRAGVCGTGVMMQFSYNGVPELSRLLFLLLRWLAGIFAALLLAAMTWQTLKVPNTQSATGILYVAVIVTFIGELDSMLLMTISNIGVAM